MQAIAQGRTADAILDVAHVVVVVVTRIAVVQTTHVGMQDNAIIMECAQLGSPTLEMEKIATGSRSQSVSSDAVRSF